MKIRTILVDDEPRAHVILENYVNRSGEIDLMGKFVNAPSALEFLKNHEVDLILLDINMPEVDGFSFLTMLERPPMVVFTTAYAEFALESYEVNAIDYLKKPIPFDRFLKAVAKVKERLVGADRTQYIPTSITLHVEGEDVLIPFEKIFYFQSLGNYVKIYTDDKVLITQMTTKVIENHLPKQKFLRIHKSFIVNRTKIQTVTDTAVLVDGKQLPIGKTFKMYFKSNVVGN